MTGITDRPALFAALGGQFSDAFGNVQVTFVVDGTAGEPVSGVFRQVRDMDLLAESGMAMEGVTHKLSVAASHLPVGFDADRDTILINDRPSPYAISMMADDGRAMTKFYLRGSDV